MTKFDLEQHSNRSVIVKYIDSNDTLMFDVTRGDLTIYNNIPAKDARALAQHILDVVPEPTPEPTLFEQQWPQVKVGAEFGFGDGAGRGGRPPYVKVSETEYQWSEGYQWSDGTNKTRTIPKPTSSDSAKGIHWINPKTIQEQVNDLADGTLFETPYNGPFIKVAKNKVYARNTQAVWTIGGGIGQQLPSWLTSINKITIEEATK